MGVAALLWSQNGIEQREIVGTPEYMAPEVVLQLRLPPELAARADVYALGCLASSSSPGRLRSRPAE